MALPFSRETAERAKEVNLVEYLKATGVPLIKEGKEYRLKEHDRLTINPITNKWNWTHRGFGGKNAVDFLMYVRGKTFVEAVGLLLREAAALPPPMPEGVPKPSPPKPFALPPPAENNRRVFSYLTRTRYILPDIVNYFIRCGDLYEDVEYHNAVFIGRDEYRVPRFATKRSTNTLAPDIKKDGTKRFIRGDVEGSDKRYGFRYVGPSDTLYMVEAPIDMLSMISLAEIRTPGRWKQDSFLAFDGLCDLALEWLLSANKYGEPFKRLIFCTDADTPGRDAASRLKDKYLSIGYSANIRPPYKGKDYNDLLKNFRETGVIV